MLIDPGASQGRIGRIARRSRGFAPTILFIARVIPGSASSAAGFASVAGRAASIIGHSAAIVGLVAAKIVCKTKNLCGQIIGKPVFALM